MQESKSESRNKKISEKIAKIFGEFAKPRIFAETKNQ